MFRRIFLSFVILTLISCLVVSCSKKTTGPNHQCATPQFSPAGGTFTTAQSVSISCATEDAVIYYTNDGNNPTETSTEYTGPITVTSNTTIKAKAFKVDFSASNTATAAYSFISPNFVLIPGGTFPYDQSDVTVSSFYIDKFETTQAEYLAVMGTNPSFFNNVPNSPANQMDWFRAIQYCNKRSIMEGLTPCYSYSTTAHGSYGTDPANWPTGWYTDFLNHTNISCNWTANGYRLPTEMEWMYAAMGANLTHGYTYSGSNDLNSVAWNVTNSLGAIHSVALKAPNEYGLYDMSGNVWEWCWDIWNPEIPTGALNNYHGSPFGENRIRRGGAWNGSIYDCWVTYRGTYYATYSSSNTGFRVCRIAP
jgi:formylglycine-generating enzyme